MKWSVIERLLNSGTGMYGRMVVEETGSETICSLDADFGRPGLEEGLVCLLDIKWRTLFRGGARI